MTLPVMAFNPADGFRNKTVYPDPETEPQGREQVQKGLDQIRDFLNEEFAPAIDKRTINAKSDDYTVVADDLNETITMTGTKTVTLPLISTEGIGTGFRVRVSNVGSGTVTVAATSTDTIAGSASVSLAPGKSIEVVADAAGIWTVHGFDFTDLISTMKADAAKYAEYTLSANQSIANSATPSPLSWGTKTAINSEAFTELSSGSVKILEAGVYEVCASVVFGSNATGLRGLYGAVNGVRKGNSLINASGSTTGLTISFFVNASVNDLITAHVMQTSGGALDVVNDSRYTYLQIKKVG